jgi:ubiquinone/menaquinone biosynthesis C-methylase UbiE
MSRFVAAIYDRFMEAAETACLADWRRALLADLSGDVLEIGAGTGANLPHYPDGLRSLTLTEPDVHMRRRLAAAVGSAPAPGVTVSDAPATRLTVADGSQDAVVCTLVLCSVPEPEAVLREVVRVLRPGGRFVYLEHVAAWDNPGRLRWQHTLEPAWRLVADGCHLTRRTGDLIRAAGLVVEREHRESMRKALPWVRPSVRGVARRVDPSGDARPGA